MMSVPILEEIQRRVALLGPHGLLVFQLPADHDDNQVELAHRIGLLDKKAHRELVFGSQPWEAVIQLLVNAVHLGIHHGKIKQGRELLQEAEAVFDHYRHLTTRNRIRYLIGTLAGVLLLALLAIVSTAVEDLLKPEFSSRELVLVCVFAGLGTIASVLSRLTKIEALEEEHSPLDLLISGASRPVVAAIFAVVVYILLDLGVLTINIGEGIDAESRVYLITSFLCGFSERFAKEILGRFLNQVTTGEK